MITDKLIAFTCILGGKLFIFINGNFREFLVGREKFSISKREFPVALIDDSIEILCSSEARVAAACDHSIPRRPFTTGGPFEAASISNGFRDIQRQI